jgi:predicted NBD/HSP70 family sugar kinase
VDYSPKAPADEWSGDLGCGVQYFSQQAVGRLLAPAGIDVDPKLGLPEKLKLVQTLMDKGDERAARIYETLGVYLGYAAAQYATRYDYRHLLVLGRVTTGLGGDLIVAKAHEVLRTEFPEWATKLSLHLPDEKSKRVGQAVAAASLPRIR